MAARKTPRKTPSIASRPTPAATKGPKGRAARKARKGNSQTKFTRNELQQIVVRSAHTGKPRSGSGE